MTEERTLTPVSGPLEAIGTCRSCTKPVAWALTAKGRRIPVDLEPTPGGNLALMRLSGTRTLHSTTLGPGDVPKGDRYVTHFFTCPSAKSIDGHARCLTEGWASDE